MTISSNTYQSVRVLLLYTARSQVLIDIAEWGTYWARLSNKWKDADPDCYLMFGLGFLHRLALAKTPKERSRFFPTRSLPVEDFFYYSFFPPTLSCLTEDQWRILIRPPVNADDNDSGPKFAWYWAHADRIPHLWYDLRDRDGLRKWAYVMWDFARLRDWGVSRRDEESLPMRTEDREFWEAIERALREQDMTTLPDGS